MDKTTTISIHRLGKKYALKNQNNEIQNEALHDISLQIKSGERWGIIGKNGSGKTTLLKILAGIIKPDTGNAQLTGNVNYILDIGGNFIPELSGKDNIALFFKINAIDESFIQGWVENAIQFADIGNAIFQPIKTYSAGMFLRVAFAAILQVKADILLVDEIFNTGDAAFREKIKKYFSSQSGFLQTLLLASHNPEEVFEFCSHCLWLEQGKIKKTGYVKDVMEAYYFHMAKENSLNYNKLLDSQTKDFHSRHSQFPFENELLIIQDFKILPKEKTTPITYESGIHFKIDIIKKTKENILNPQIILLDYTRKPILTLFPKIASQADTTNKKLRSYQGKISYTTNIAPYLLTSGTFYAELRFGKDADLEKDFNEEAARLPESIGFEIQKSNTLEYASRTENIFIRPDAEWKIKTENS